AALRILRNRQRPRGREIGIVVTEAAEHAYSRERCESENSQRPHLGLDAEVQRDDLVVDDTEELLLEVGASPPARLDRIVAVQLIAADDAVDARAVRDPRAALLAVVLVIEEPCSDA